MRFRVLGPLEARTSQHGPARLGTCKQRTLLAVLLLHANHLVSVERLMTALWPGRPPRSAVGLVRTYASALRQGLQLNGDQAPRLAAGGGGYRLDVDPLDLDMLIFGDLAARGRDALASGDPAKAARLLEDSLALWRGHVLEDVLIDADSESFTARLEESRNTAEEAWVDARLALGDNTDLADLIVRVRLLIEEQPLREHSWEQLMIALCRMGRPAEALAAFAEFRQRMADELGGMPSLALRRLHCQILAGDAAIGRPPLLPAAAVASTTIAGTSMPPPRQLPQTPAGFAGRARELAEIGALAERAVDAVVVCVISAAIGMGKTALAVHAGHRLCGRFPDGQLYVNLHGSDSGKRLLTPPAALSGLLRALGADPAACPPDQDGQAAMYRSLLAGRRVLIALDDAVSASQVRPLIPGTPGCIVLVTSRGRLGGLVASHGAHLTTIGPLSNGESTALLANIAGTGRVHAEPGAALRIAEACGGLPLALRVAAARLAARPSWPLRGLAERLQPPASRLDELAIEEVGIRDTLRRAHEALHERGQAAERTAMRDLPLLGLLDGDLTLRAAATLLSRTEPETEQILGRLVQAGWLDNPAPGQYWMHELTRLFTRELLADGTRQPSSLDRSCA